MSIEDFITERKASIGTKIPLSQMFKNNTYVDCHACDHIRTEGGVEFCELSNSAIPKEVIPLGCDKGVEDEIPF